MIQFPDISSKIHRFHSFALRIEKQMNLGYNSSSSLICTDHQSHWFPQKNRTHLLSPGINFNVFFLFFSVLHLCFSTAFLVVQLLQLKSWQCPRKRTSSSLKNLGSAMTRLTGRSPHKPLSPRKQTLIYAQTQLIGPHIFHPFQISASVVTQCSKMNLCKTI